LRSGKPSQILDFFNRGKGGNGALKVFIAEIGDVHIHRAPAVILHAMLDAVEIEKTVTDEMALDRVPVVPYRIGVAPILLAPVFVLGHVAPLSFVERRI
jgi:hypothetical protein